MSGRGTVAVELDQEELAVRMIETQEAPVQTEAEYMEEVAALEALGEELDEREAEIMSAADHRGVDDPAIAAALEDLEAGVAEHTRLVAALG